MKFYIGLHHPSDAWPFLRSVISINSLRNRKRGFRVNEWMLDSGAFSEIGRHGAWREPPDAYADQINRWKECGRLVAAVTQDMMCEDFMLERTGLSIQHHQDITTSRYLLLRTMTDVYVMPVLQGYDPPSYLRHLADYGSMLAPDQWVGVGSVCKRNGNPSAIEDVLLAIHQSRPDLRLHGFGIKLSALESPTVRALLYSSDSMAWSWWERKEKYRRPDADEHDPRNALSYCARVEEIVKEPGFIQAQLFGWWNPDLCAIAPKDAPTITNVTTRCEPPVSASAAVKPTQPQSVNNARAAWKLTESALAPAQGDVLHALRTVP